MLQPLLEMELSVRVVHASYKCPAARHVNGTIHVLWSEGTSSVEINLYKGITVVSV
jgi:hypothetical protein